MSSFSWGNHRSWVPPPPPGIWIQLKPGTNSSSLSAPSGINSSLYQEQPELFVVGVTWPEAAWMKRCVWDELPGYSPSSEKQIPFCRQVCKSSMSTEFPSGGKSAQKSNKPSELNKDVEVPDLSDAHQDSTTISAASHRCWTTSKAADRNHEAP